MCSDPAATETPSERMVLTSSSVACVADSSAALWSSVRVPHTQSQCADTIAPGAGAGASESSPFFHCTRSGAGLAECQRTVVELQWA